MKMDIAMFIKVNLQTINPQPNQIMLEGVMQLLKLEQGVKEMQHLEVDIVGNMDKFLKLGV